MTVAVDVWYNDSMSGLKFMPLSEVLSPKKKRYKYWKVSKKYIEPRKKYEGYPGYHITKSEVHSSYEIFDWLVHLKPKNWVTDEMLSELIDIFDNDVDWRRW